MPDEPAENPLTEVLELSRENGRRLTTLHTDVGELLATLPALQKSVSALSEGFQGLRDEVSELSASQSKLSASQSKLSASQSKLRSEIMDRIDRLQETVEFVRDDARVNWATADTAINRARKSREDIDDLLKMIAAMERRFQTLASLVDGLRKSETKKPDDQ